MEKTIAYIMEQFNLSLILSANKFYNVNRASLRKYGRTSGANKLEFVHIQELMSSSCDIIYNITSAFPKSKSHVIDVIMDFVDMHSERIIQEFAENQNIPAEFIDDAIPRLHANYRRTVRTYIEQCDSVNKILVDKAFDTQNKDLHEILIGDEPRWSRGRTVLWGVGLYGIHLLIALFVWYVATSHLRAEFANSADPSFSASTVNLATDLMRGYGRHFSAWNEETPQRWALTDMIASVSGGFLAQQIDHPGNATAAAAVAFRRLFETPSYYYLTMSIWGGVVGTAHGVADLLGFLTPTETLREDYDREARQDWPDDNEGHEEARISCSVCQEKRALHRCMDCKGPVYCSAKCQKIDWIEGGHSENCRAV